VVKKEFDRLLNDVRTGQFCAPGKTFGPRLDRGPSATNVTHRAGERAAPYRRRMANALPESLRKICLRQIVRRELHESIDLDGDSQLTRAAS
jgi:hypothetical protein